MKTFPVGTAINIEREIFGPDGIPASEKQALRQAFDIAQLVYDLRTARNLTQSELAKLIGTTQPVIARLEDADYHGHSLTMLRRIADALGLRLRIEFEDPAAPAKSTRSRKTA